MSSYPDPIGLMALIVAFGVLPFVALMMTCYTKLVVVFGLLRAALGLQQTPPNMVINGIAIVLSAYIMAPVGMDAFDALQQQGKQQKTGADQIVAVFDAARGPIVGFLEKHTHAREREFFVRSAASIWPKERAKSLSSSDLLVLVPSFVLSELARAFQIGFILYLVFVVVDLIVATVLLSLGMSMLAPTTVSVPFKLLLFVVLEGWTRLIHGLVLSYS